MPKVHEWSLRLGHTHHGKPGDPNPRVVRERRHTHSEKQKPKGSAERGKQRMKKEEERENIERKKARRKEARRKKKERK